jgi:hypothetical protein
MSTASLFENAAETCIETTLLSMCKSNKNTQARPTQTTLLSLCKSNENTQARPSQTTIQLMEKIRRDKKNRI